MPSLAHVPPGRAGRLWLRRRLGTAERGRDQLERKLRVLAPELERRRLHRDQRHRQWAADCRDAQVWVLRAGLLGGQDALDRAAPARPVEVRLRWSTTVGVTYPVEAELVDLAPDATLGRTVGNAAVEPAAAAFRRALLAGVEAAAADEALRRVEEEARTTRRRLRALEQRWLPWLQDRLTTVESALEQAEQEDAARLRHAVGTDRGAGP
ncbi:V-type ATP synthase subunit D [uncultured Cellulomonas sp.]|uniref:V-type ATP synthase subunit D n=1 Tax=uncultured Cellulomonas sp. TaxID=189682 RepID=UPI002614322E|nr:V-type ATP synthase subunit D [uncultured Cellulomonas sp.]